MTLPGALPGDDLSPTDQDDPSAEASPPSSPPARRTRPVAVWTAAGLALALVVAWQVAGRSPALVPSGVGYVDTAFVQYQNAFPTRYASWVVWDEPAGAQVAMVLRNDRPWPVTVAAMDPNTITTTRLASLAPGDEGTLGLTDYTFSDRITVPADGQLVLAVQISAGCVPMSAGTTSGASAVTLATTSLGVPGTATVELETAVVAGFTTDHEPGPECAG